MPPHFKRKERKGDAKFRKGERAKYKAANPQVPSTVNGQRSTVNDHCQPSTVHY